MRRPSKGAGPTSTSRIGRTKEFRPRASETWEGMPPEFMWNNQGQNKSKKVRSLLKAPIFPYFRQHSIQMRYIREWFSLQQDEILRLSEDTRDNER